MREYLGNNKKIPKCNAVFGREVTQLQGAGRFATGAT
jgi:hypothetical protein